MYGRCPAVNPRNLAFRDAATITRDPLRAARAFIATHRIRGPGHHLGHVTNLREPIAWAPDACGGPDPVTTARKDRDTERPPAWPTRLGRLPHRGTECAP